jgi:hypothetical protein
MELYVKRRYLGDIYTIGSFSNGLTYLCDTLEDKVRDLIDLNHDGDFTDSNEGKVYGQTAIPYGRYEVKLFFWTKHQKEYPLLQNVPGFSGIFIHGGVTEKDTEGCILVGENKIKGQLINSSTHLNVIIKLMEEARRKGEKVYITIGK